MTSFVPDAEFAIFLQRLSAAWREHPPLADLSIEQARAVAEQVRAPWRAGGPAMASTREETIALPHGDMRVRIHRPHGLSDGPAPTLIYLHGGGFVFFSIDTHDRLMREYADAAGVVVLGVDYPLSPEHRYPVALDQIVALVRWLDTNGAKWGVDAGATAIGGDSAGANLALAAALRLHDAGERHRLRGVLSNYGAFAGTVSDMAEAKHGGVDALLNRAEMRYYFDSYVGSLADVADPFAQPLLREDLTHLPPMFFAIPESDVLRDQSETMVGRALACGVDVTARIYKGTTHSFLEAMSVAHVARHGIMDGSAWLRQVLRDAAEARFRCLGEGGCHSPLYRLDQAGGS